MLLKFKPFAAPTRYVFKDPDTGHDYEAPDAKALYDLIRNYRIQNQLEPIDMLPAVVDNFLCRLDENAGKCTPYAKLKRGLIQFVRGGVSLLKNVAYSSFVDQSEADRRAEICLNCPHNIFPDRKAFIRWADDVTEAAVGDRRSTYHDQLGNCGVCSCLLRSKVFLDGKVKLSEDEVQQMERVGCWQLKLRKAE